MELIHRLNDMSSQSSCAQWPGDTDNRADSKADALVSYTSPAKSQQGKLTSTGDRIGLGVRASAIRSASILDFNERELQ